jgi:acyl carrier protein
MLSYSVSIGKPISNTKIYILDQYLQPLPIGITGEIYIGGIGVARGYLNQPELTAEKFINNPFDSGKLYKTGDLAKYLPDGNIEFIGRIDEQVKIRGFRIELGEIEKNLLQHPNIKETVVIALENEQKYKYLVAYFVTNKSIKITEIRDYLAQKLPDYMIPSAFVFLDKFPLTPNGKIDKKALPKPDFDTYRENEFIAPRNEIEMKLAQIWQEVLNIENIGINDNFFSLGGHSLLATQIVSRIRTNLGVELPLRNLFEYPTIAQLGDRLSQFIIMETGEI